MESTVESAIRDIKEVKEYIQKVYDKLNFLEEKLVILEKKLEDIPRIAVKDLSGVVERLLK